MSALPGAMDNAARRSLDRRHVYIFPTRHGVLLGVMVFVILLGSINYDNALGYLLTFLLFGLFLVTMLHTFRNLFALSYLGADAEPVFAGESARFLASLDNRGRWPRYSVEVACRPRVPWRERRARARSFAAPVSIASDTLARAVVPVETHTRGWQRLGRLRISSTFPLGILRAWAYVEDNSRCLVYPRPVARLPLPEGTVGGNAARMGADAGADDFAGFRPYRSGDPVRAVAWKTLARQDAVLVKRFTSGVDAALVLRLDDCAVLPDLETRLGQLTQWVVEADTRGIPFGLELPSVSIAPALGAPHRHRCLGELALYRK